MIRLLLVIPGPDSPPELLAEGDCGARPPMVTDHGESPTGSPGWQRWVPSIPGWGSVPPAALVLAVDGKELWQGREQLAHVPRIEEWGDAQPYAMDASYTIRMMIRAALSNNSRKSWRGIRRLERIAALIGARVEVVHG